MRDAFMRVALDGMSYEAVAIQLGCHIGTVKSRVSRARTRLGAVLEGCLSGQDRASGASV